jgi:hypothetical protein
MSADNMNQPVNRRGFLKAAASTAVVAAAAGAGAAVLLDGGKTTVTTVAPPIKPEAVVSSATVADEASELFARLVKAQAENVRLQAELAASQRQVESARSALVDQDVAAAEAWQRQLNEANAEVFSLSEQLNVLNGLVGLYEQFEEIDLAAVTAGGIATVGGALAVLGQQAPLVSEGLQAGQVALAELEEQLPAVQEARGWLIEQTEILGRAYGTVEYALQDAVDAAGNLLQLFGEWFDDVRKWLPFGIGQRAARLISALTELLAETPVTIAGARENVVRPLDVWLEQKDGQTRLQRRIIKPVREQALDQAAIAVTQVQNVQTAYQVELAEPVEAAANRQRAIRDLISQYRQEHLV